MDTMLEERFILARERIVEIPTEADEHTKWGKYFAKTASFLDFVLNVYEKKKNGNRSKMTEEEKAEENKLLYQDILPENYGLSYANPKYAVECLGEEYGQIFSLLTDQLRGCIAFAFEEKLWDLTILCELFLQIYSEFEQEEIPKAGELEQVIYSYVRDYCDEMIRDRTRELVDPSCHFAYDIIMDSDLKDLSYLYEFGEYISENERKIAAFLNSLSEDEIDRMASVYTEGYRIGFVNAHIDLSKKRTVNIRYTLGFERLVRRSIELFEKMGLKAIIYRSASHLISRRSNVRIGFYGAIPNRQYDYDHRNDAALYLTEEMAGRKLRALRNAFEEVKELAHTHAGPAVMETFGERPFSPASCPESWCLTEAQRKIKVHIDNESAQITNRYIIGSERSFTIIAWPVPEIGENFEDIFRETVKINTLDYHLYQKIQQSLIDCLDQGERVRIQGKGANRTDLIVELQKMSDPSGQTIFENCVADVNIPVGEVFTSPQLEGTNGTLHVSRVFLEGLEYQNLCLTFEEGMVKSYSCSNFEDDEENRAYICENIMKQHDSLPMGEFAIGTNTTAYMVAKKYQIAEYLPILIAEKMGPHFAVGDTCYSWSEDTPVYNPDGKEIFARDNSVSLHRKNDIAKAYFNCHTDITIPYDELGSIAVQRKDGQEILIIKDGLFVLPGTEKLNEPFYSHLTMTKGV